MRPYFIQQHYLAMNKLNTYLLLVLCLFATLAVSAQKFGYINSQQLIQQIPQVKEANAELETLQKQYENQMQNKATALQTKYQALARKQEQGEISPKQFETESATLEQERMEVAKFQQEIQQNLSTKSEDLLKPIRDRINDAINEVAKENGYTYIFDMSVGVLLYAEESTDVGALVKAKLGI